MNEKKKTTLSNFTLVVTIDKSDYDRSFQFLFLFTSKNDWRKELKEESGMVSYQTI
jgi:hypothetical protein